jgi:hypothetical protein
MGVLGLPGYFVRGLSRAFGYRLASFFFDHFTLKFVVKNNTGVSGLVMCL